MRYGKFPGGKWLSPQSTCTSVLDKISAAVERTLALKSWYLMLISEKRSLSVLWIINRTGILQLHRFRLLKEHTSTNSLSKELLVLLTRNSSYLITLQSLLVVIFYFLPQKTPYQESCRIIIYTLTKLKGTHIGKNMILNNKRQ